MFFVFESKQNVHIQICLADNQFNGFLTIKCGKNRNAKPNNNFLFLMIFTNKR